MCSFHVGRQHESSLPPQDVVREAENNSVPPLAWPHVFPFQEVAPDLVADCPLAKQITPPEITTWKPENDGFPKGIFGFWGLRFKRFHVNKFPGCTDYSPGIHISKFCFYSFHLFLSASKAGGQFLHKKKHFNIVIQWRYPSWRVPVLYLTYTIIWHKPFRFTVYIYIWYIQCMVVYGIF